MFGVLTLTSTKGNLFLKSFDSAVEIFVENVSHQQDRFVIY